MNHRNAAVTLREQDAAHGETIPLPTVYHVGNLDEERAVPYTSQEGGELSISVHPDVWEGIIRGDGTATHETLHTYELSNGEAEFYYVDPTAELEAERAWCIDAGYITEVTGYRVSFTDENGDERYLKVKDEGTAQEEAASRQSRYTEEPILTLAAKGVNYWSKAFRQAPEHASPVLIEGLLPIWYASHLDVDGVWWAEQLAPEKRSAPRGCIFQNRLDRWDKEITGTTKPAFDSPSRPSA
ncbi:hypothetical protein [Halorubrum sp. AJ67]|uniref:hypothetical protein n=1 Tax=Halorubrum sp. AJ67 TaxID=1173487 RepID=UPI0003DDADE6|nr:hypothetical protein [Halorubrum sp. AJ67]CDK38057.1 hypothetical protein BN903_257 [Halorubrum sp. AJ67]